MHNEVPLFSRYEGINPSVKFYRHLPLREGVKIGLNNTVSS